jgi:ABC transporter family protein
LRSAVPGRVRWEVDGLRNRPWRAATAETALQHTPGILSVEATPRTGRLLVHYDAALSTLEITRLVRIALGAPLSRSEGYGGMLGQTGERWEGAAPVRHEHSGRHHHTPGAGEKWRWRYGRRLLLVSLALTHRVPIPLVGLLFLLLLGFAGQRLWLALGMVWVSSVLVLPMATAHLITARLARLLGCAAGLAALSIGLGYWLAAQIVWRPSAFVALSSLACYLGVRWLVAKGGSAHQRWTGERSAGSTATIMTGRSVCGVLDGDGRT